MGALYAVVAEVLIRILGYVMNKHQVNVETKQNFHAFVEMWQKSKSTPVAHYENDRDLLQQIKEDSKK